MALPKIDPERNREIIARRGCWPPGALTVVRELEARFPAWYAWWTPKPWRADGNVPDGPAFGAALIHNTRAGCSLYATTPEELAQLIHKADEERAALHRHRRQPWAGDRP